MAKKLQCPQCSCVFFDSLPPRFVPPSVEEVAAYCLERKNAVDPQAFIDHYEASGWIRGKTKIKSWKACVHTWEKSSKDAVVGTGSGPVCPLCEKYRVPLNAVTCAHCGPYCKKCGQQTARLTIVRRRDQTKSAVCEDCLAELRGSR